MPTFIIADNPDLQEPLRLCPDDEHHLVRSLRVQAGDPLQITNNAGLIAQCKILSTQPLSFKILERREVPPPPDLTLGLPLIQHERLEWALEKLTEMNIAKIQLIATERCQMKSLPDSRLQRLKKILRQAQIQSGRAWPVGLLPPCPWQDGIPTHCKNLIAAHAEGPSAALLDSFPIFAIIGPEGGWTPQEIDDLGKRGFTFISLGETILRTETAAIVLAARLLSHVTAT